MPIMPSRPGKMLACGRISGNTRPAMATLVSAHSEGCGEMKRDAYIDLDDYTVRDGEKIRVPIMLMDARRFEAHRPGFRVMGRAPCASQPPARPYVFQGGTPPGPSHYPPTRRPPNHTPLP